MRHWHGAFRRPFNLLRANGNGVIRFTKCRGPSGRPPLYSHGIEGKVLISCPPPRNRWVNNNPKTPKSSATVTTNSEAVGKTRFGSRAGVSRHHFRTRRRILDLCVVLVFGLSPSTSPVCYIVALETLRAISETVYK